MLSLLKRLHADDHGIVVTSELLLVSTVAVAGLSVGLTCLRDGVTQELNDVANAIGSLNQSYSYSGMSGCRTDCPNRAFSRGSQFVDVQDGGLLRQVSYDADAAAAASDAESTEQSEIQRLQERREMLERLRVLEERRDELERQQAPASDGGSAGSDSADVDPTSAQELVPIQTFDPDLPPLPAFEGVPYDGASSAGEVEQAPGGAYGTGSSSGGAPASGFSILREGDMAGIPEAPLPSAEDSHRVYGAGPASRSSGTAGGLPSGPAIEWSSEFGTGSEGWQYYGERPSSHALSTRSYEGSTWSSSPATGGTGRISERAAGKILGYTRSEITRAGRVFPHINNYDSRFVGPPAPVGYLPYQSGPRYLPGPVISEPVSGGWGSAW